MRVAALVTSFNRRLQTLECLAALTSHVPAGIDVSVFLTDDASSDGTRDAVLAAHPDVVVIPGTGGLYWAGGMAAAEMAAVQADPDYYLWLNDDTVLDAGALGEMLGLGTRHPDAIVIGATRDPATGELNYGGHLRPGAHPQKLPLVTESVDVQQVEAFNGNCVLVPRQVHEAVGPIDGEFGHHYADIDYALRAASLGIRLLQAPGTLATCPSNPPRQRSAGFVTAWKDLQSPKGLPWSSQVRYLRRHGDWRWPFWLVAGQTKRVITRRV